MKQFFLLILVLIAVTLVACDATAEPTTSVNPSILGTDDLQFSWAGDFAADPYACTEDVKYDAYRTTSNNASYFCDGTAWRLIAQDGSDGVSIIWLGSFATDPASPSVNQAYHNTTDGNSYIYNGSTWVILVQGRYIKVIDSTSVYLGYALSEDVVFTSKGYLLGLYQDVNDPTKVRHTSPAFNAIIYYSGTDCTGTPYVAHTNKNDLVGFTGKLMYNITLNQFYNRKNTTIIDYTYQSYYFESIDTCTNLTHTATGYEYEPISRTDAGIPSSITPPFTFLFQ